MNVSETILVTIITETLKSEKVFYLFVELTKGFSVSVCTCCTLFTLSHIHVLAQTAPRFPKNYEWMFVHMGNIISACQVALHSL